MFIFFSIFAIVMTKRLAILMVMMLSLLSAWAYEGNMSTHSAIANGGYPFWIYTPAGYNGTQPTPVIIFLHGKSLSGNNLQRVLRYGTLDAIKRGMTIPTIVIAPQTPGGWKPEKLNDLLEWTERNYKVDATRVYVLGMSMGGYGTMDFCGTYPHKLAAGMALCGGCYLKNVDPLGDIPLWIIHGTADRAVAVGESKKVVARLQEHHADSRLRYDWLPGASHGALARAFYLKDTYDWLFAHSLGDEGRPVMREIDIDNAILKQAYSELRELTRLVGEDDMSEDPTEYQGK